MSDKGRMSCTMTYFRLLLFCISQVPVTWCVETQTLGYEDTLGLTLSADVASNSTVIPDPLWPFPSDGQVVAFNVRVHGNGLGSNVTLQIWRPMDASRGYSLVGASREIDSYTTGYQRITLAAPQRILRGDVIGLYSQGQNPVPYHLLTGGDCNRTGYLYLEGDAGALTGSQVTASGSDVTRTFHQGAECRRYLVTAEYELEVVDLTMSILGDDVMSRSESDVTDRGVVMPHVQSGFPANGTLYGWKGYLQGPGQVVVFQVWRLDNGTRYTKVHESPPYTQPVAGAVHFRLRPAERAHLLLGDVIALGYPRGNPIRFDWSKKCDYPCLMAADGGADVSAFVASPGGKACRKYSFQAEYYHQMPELPLANITTPISTTTPTPTTETTPTTTRSTTAAINTANTANTTTATTTATTSEVTTTSDVTTTPQYAVPPSTAPVQVDFGWEAPSARKEDGVHSGTIIPDVGHGFPHDGKVVGWAFNASRVGFRLGLQVWRPMPEHRSLAPHARDFAFVGGTKPVLPWHRGENRFSLDQVGEAPFAVRRGDVIGLRLEALNPVPYTADTICAARYYMDHHGRFGLCDQYIMQRTAVCRVYPVKAIVIWDEDEMGTKAQTCVDETSRLVQSLFPTPATNTHIDGCLILNVKSADATYQLTNPEYPNITKYRDLCWVIHLDPKLYSELYIQIKINDLDLRSKKCEANTSDFLEIRDGQWSTSDLLRRYCSGWTTDGDVITRTDVITACHHVLYLRLRTSKASFGFRGFKLHYQAVTRSSDGTMCIRALPIPAPNAARSRNAAIITLVVVALFIGLVCLVAYVRKVGLKVPPWCSGYFFRHRLFHNQEMGGFGPGGFGPGDGSDSPRRNPHRNSEHQPAADGGATIGGVGGGGDGGGATTGGGGQSSGYVTFVAGGYPTHGEPALQLAKMAATRPDTTATDSSVMEGTTDIGEPIPDSWSPAPNGLADGYCGERMLPVDSPLGGVNNINYCPQNDSSPPSGQRVNGAVSTGSVT